MNPAVIPRALTTCLVRVFSITQRGGVTELFERKDIEMRRLHLIILSFILSIALSGGGCAVNKTQKGAGIGAGAGAATGAIIGATVGAPGVGAAIGAGAGGTVGALVGNVMEKMEKDKKEKEEIKRQLEEHEASK